MAERFTFLADPKLARLLALLNPPGEETRVVGGAVRSALMGLTPADFDLATTLPPDAVMLAGDAAGLRAVPTGVAFGTVTLVLEGTGFEVTTLREDIETDGRHAKVRFGRNFVADALRRDFTMNALSVSATGQLYDYVGGQADIEAGIVRFIGEAKQRIAEDHLRSLRFFRFYAAFGRGLPDQQALTAIIAARHGLLQLSRERIRAEVLKLLAADGAAQAAQIMSDCGLFGLLTAGVAAPARLGRLMQQPQTARDSLLRLAALAVWTIEDARRIGEYLRLSRAERERLEAAARVLACWHGAAQPPDAQLLQKSLLLEGRQAAADGLWLAALSRPGQDWGAAHAQLASLPQPRLPFSSADLRTRGIAEGPKMGAMLKTLQANWIRAGFPRDAAVLSQLLADVTREG